MKTYTLFCLLIAVFFFTSCTETVELRDQLIGEWSMIKKTGGENEIECDFAVDKVVWNFDANQISISNNDIFSTLCDAPETANHIYILEEFEDDFYLQLDGIITGRISIPDDQTLSIDGNFTKDGEISDEFVFSFSRPE